MSILKFVQAQKSCDDFDVSTREVSEGVYLGTITVKTPLNYETKSSYIMNIVALVSKMGSMVEGD